MYIEDLFHSFIGPYSVDNFVCSFNKTLSIQGTTHDIGEFPFQSEGNPYSLNHEWDDGEGFVISYAS
jgi:hypothetical protein